MAWVNRRWLKMDGIARRSGATRRLMDFLNSNGADSFRESPSACPVGVLEGTGVGPQIVSAALAVLKTIEQIIGVRFDVRCGGDLSVRMRRHASDGRFRSLRQPSAGRSSATRALSSAGPVVVDTCTISVGSSICSASLFRFSRGPNSSGSDALQTGIFTTRICSSCGITLAACIRGNGANGPLLKDGWWNTRSATVNPKCVG